LQEIASYDEYVRGKLNEFIAHKKPDQHEPKISNVISENKRLQCELEAAKSEIHDLKKL
jgi:hypothetical protein